MDLEEKRTDLLPEYIVTVRLSIYFYIKRFFDMVFALIGLVLLSGLILLIALIIKVNDPNGPVFFKQERVGKNGKSFKMYKFRSMYSNAEERLEELLHHNEVQGAMFKIKNDPRITSVGKYLRKFSIDELPQLINVLKGDMSLIGPRPPLPREVKEYSEYDKKRLQITPGITGLWQVSGRNSLSFKEMVELDLQYIANVSILTDAKIFFKTIIVVLKSDNAY